MPQTKARSQIETLQEIIELVAANQVSEEEGRKRAEELWEEAEQGSVIRQLLRALFPSLSREST